MSRRAIRAFYRNLELEVFHYHAIIFFYTYVYSRFHPHPASPRLINPHTPNSLTNDPDLDCTIFTMYFGCVYNVDDNLRLLHIDILPMVRCQLL